MPFANYDDFESCVRANSDKDNPEAYCATIKRQVEGQAAEFDDVDLSVLLETADAHAEELLAEFLQTAIAEQEGDVDESSQEQIDGLAVDVFRITQAEDNGMDLDGDLMGVGVDFPNAGVYVDWHIDAWPDDEQLEEPHVSDYGSIEDLEQATGGVVEHLETIEATDVDAAIEE